MYATTVSPALRRARLAAGLFYFLQGLIFASWAGHIPDVKEALSLSDGDLGLALFAIPMGQILMMAISGWLVTRIGSRRMTILSLLVYATALVLIGTIGSFMELCVALFLFGVTANMINIAVNTQATIVEGLYGRNIMSTFHGMWSLGGLAGGLLCTLFDVLSLTRLSHFISIALLTLLSVLFFAKHLAQDPVRTVREEGEEKAPGGSLLRREPLLLLLGVIGFAGMFSEGTLFDWSSVYFAKEVPIDPSHARLGYIAGMAAMTTGRFLADRFVTRYGAPRVLRVAGAMIALGLLVAVLFPVPLPATLGFVLVGFGICSIVPTCYSLAGRLESVESGIAITVVSSVSFIGFLIGPPLIGLLSELTSLRIALGLASLFGLLIILLATRLGRR